jgi:hypothetical protein
MTAVAGDFYEFIPVDQNRVGVLVADVSGHGVPAALIEAMIKVAMQSVASCAREPREGLRGLILSGQLRGQLISAAYLWLDTETGKALYSAAGHPPLLCWQAGRLERIEGKRRQQIKVDRGNRSSQLVFLHGSGLLRKTMIRSRFTPQQSRRARRTSGIVSTIIRSSANEGACFSKIPTRA